MNCAQSLPEGYRQILAIDLQKDKKTAWKVQGLSFALGAVLFGIGCCLVPFSVVLEHTRNLGGYLLRLGLLLGGMLLYLVFHELTHAAVMKAYGAKKLRFGFTGAYAFAGSLGDYFGKRAYRHIALAPLLVWTLVFGVLCALVPRDWFWVAWMLQLCNISGASGDIYVTLRLLREPPDLLVNDTGVSMTVYSAQ